MRETIRRFKILLVLAVVTGIVNGQNGIYTVVAPRTIRPNLPYNVGVSIDADSPVSVVVSLKATLSSGGSSTSTQQSVIDPGTSQLITLRVGDLIDVGATTLTVRGSNGLNFENSTELVFSPKSSTIIIQTDKPIYKPGELLQFRVLFLDKSFRPKGPGPLDVWLKDSKGNVIKKWDNAVVQKGLFSAEMQLSDEPNFGDWSIQVRSKSQTEVHTFLIAKYVLPKFNVDIETPPFATFNDSKVRIRVKADYVYKKPVTGQVVISATPGIHSTYIQPVFTGIAQKTADIDGFVDFDFDFTKELSLTDDYQRTITIEADVTESLTGRKQNATKTITLHKYPYKIEVARASESFKPGLPYSITVKIATQDDKPVSDSRPDALLVKYGFTYNHEEYQTAKYSIPPTGLVTMNFDPPTNESYHVLGIEATYKDLTEWFPTFQRAQSPSNTYIQAKLNTRNPKVNEEIEIEVESTRSFDSLNYELLGRGDLLLSRKVTLPSASNRLSFRLLPPPNAAPRAKLVIYTVYEKEVIADLLEFDIAGSLDNFINIALSATETEPGREIDVLVTTKPNSLIGLKAIDQSVLVLKQDKNVDLRTVEKEQESWMDMPEGSGSRNIYRRSLFGHSAASTAAQVFEDAGLVIMTNALVHQKPPIVFYRANFLDDASINPEADSVGDDPPNAPTRPRTKFPETFLWEQLTAGYDGRTAVRKTVPDTITSWMISGFALDPVYGLGVMEAPMSMKVFRPFFVDLNIPYSVVKDEVVGVQVLVHNYMNRDVNAEVTLGNKEQQFSFTQDENEIDDEKKLVLYRTERVVVKANSVNSVTFLITPKSLGTIDLHVTAASRVAGDEIVKQLLVKPPGQPQYLNNATFLDLRSGRSESVNLTARFPAKRVNDSDFVKFSVVADILGPALTNLDKLLELPTGCGEQNMVKFVPDIIVLEYLQASRQLTEPIRQKAIQFLETGYQRELSYRHDDGSFSAFGKSDSSGSTWLTAFVVRSFLLAKPHIYIDREVIEQAVEWLVSKQDLSGSFPEVGKILDIDLASENTKGLGLTAYVLMALLEADNDREFTKTARFSTAINLSLNYVARSLQDTQDPYTISMIAYAMHLANHPLRDSAFNVLEGLAQVTDNDQQKFWDRKKTEYDLRNPWTSNARPVSIETTAYALLVYMQRNLFGDSVPVIKWLLAHRNEQGGFISTQDTVVGLAALARFARFTKSGTTDMSIDITYEGGTKNIQLNSNNAIVLQEIKLPASTRWVNVESHGTGIGLVQLSWGYNLEVTGAWPSFRLDPQIEKTTSTANQFHLSICTEFIGGNTSNMAVMEVNVPTGFAISEDNLPNLLHYPEVKRFETDDRNSKLVVYFNELKRQEVCPTVSAHRIYPVAKQAPAYITVYDYYDSSRKARQFYSPPKTTLCDICEETNCSQECLVARRQQQADILGRNAAKGGAAPAGGPVSLPVAMLFVIVSILEIVYLFPH